MKGWVGRVGLITCVGRVCCVWYLYDGHTSDCTGRIFLSGTVAREGREGMRVWGEGGRKYGVRE